MRSRRFPLVDVELELRVVKSVGAANAKLLVDVELVLKATSFDESTTSSAAIEIGRFSKSVTALRS